ncbi:MAG: hypothetical protein U0U70_16820 [Chitinophagaceae bacterium]
MKKTISVSALALFVIVARPQQPPSPNGAPPPPPGIEERIKKTSELLQKEVQPDAQQKIKIEAAYRKFFTAEEKIHKPGPPQQGQPPAPDSKTKEAMDKLVKEREETIKKILNDKQYGKYKEAIKKLRPPGPMGGNGRQPPPPQ